jgi:antirestriction protein ArdC
MLSHSGAEIRHGGAKAYYSPSSDHIQMPEKDCFVDEQSFSGAAPVDGLVK